MHFLSKAEATTAEADAKDKKPRRPITPNLGARGGRGGARGGKREGNLIQSHSIFEAGPAESSKRCNFFRLELQCREIDPFYIN